MGTPEGPGAGPTPAVRLIFEYDGEDVRLVSRQPVEMTLPPPRERPAEAAPPSFQAELRNTGGEVLHSVAIPNPISPDREVFSQDPGQTIGRVVEAAPRGAFTVVVPQHDEADHVALVTTHPEGGTGEPMALERDAPPPTREVARFPLRGEPGEGGGR